MGSHPQSAGHFGDGNGKRFFKVKRDTSFGCAFGGAIHMEDADEQETQDAIKDRRLIPLTGMLNELLVVCSTIQIAVKSGHSIFWHLSNCK